MFISKAFHHKFVDGEVGIEIEVEGTNLPTRIKGWDVKQDGSLRGESYEYVLTNPIRRDEVVKYLNRIGTEYAMNESRVYDTGRAGIHIHLNMNDYTITQTFNTILLYYLFEDCLVHWCGKARVGNLFCLRLKDAEGLSYFIEEALTNNLQVLNTDSIRYASLNMKSLSRFGSLEFRAMKSTAVSDDISEWISMLLTVKDAALKFKSPLDIYNKFYELGGDYIADVVWESHSDMFKKHPTFLEEMQRVLDITAIAVNTTDWAKLNFVDEPSCDC